MPPGTSKIQGWVYGCPVFSNAVKIQLKMAQKTKLRNKINSMTLQSGVIVDFQDNGNIHLSNKYEHDGNVIKLNSHDIEEIRFQAKRNGEIEAGNGVEIVNKDSTKV